MLQRFARTSNANMANCECWGLLNFQPSCLNRENPRQTEETNPFHSIITRARSENWVKPKIGMLVIHPLLPEICHVVSIFTVYIL